MTTDPDKLAAFDEAVEMAKDGYPSRLAHNPTDVVNLTARGAAAVEGHERQGHQGPREARGGVPDHPAPTRRQGNREARRSRGRERRARPGQRDPKPSTTLAE